MALIPQGILDAGSSVSQATRLPLRWAHPSSSSQSKNFLQANNSISPCATQKQASSFSILKDSSTITMPRRNCLPSAAESSRCRAILPTLLGGLQRPAQWWEKSLSARPCSRWKSRSLLMGNSKE